MSNPTDRKRFQEAGAAAYGAGTPVTANPYDRERQWTAYYEWDSGWVCAEIAAERKARNEIGIDK